MTKKSLLIGSSGRIGRMTLRAWRAENSSWRDNPAQYRNQNMDGRQSDLVWDITQGLRPIEKWIEKNGPIFTFILLTGVTPATGVDMDDNISIAVAYLKAAQALNVPRVLVASSSAVYGAGIGQPMSETDPCYPLNAYGRSKLEMEHEVLAFRQEGLDVCCLRIGNVAGADALLLNAKNNPKKEPLLIDIFPDQHGPQRSYIGPASLGQALGHLANHKERLPFLLNVAAPEPVYMEEILEAAGLPWAPRVAPAHVPQRIILNCKNLANLVPLTPEMGSASTLISEWRKYG